MTLLFLGLCFGVLCCIGFCYTVAGVVRDELDRERQRTAWEHKAAKMRRVK